MGPGPRAGVNVGQEGEHEVKLLLNRTEKWGVTRYLVRSSWRNHSSVNDEWLRAEELGHCPEKVAEYDAAVPRRRAARRGDSGPAAVPVPAARAGARVVVPPPAGLAPLVSPAG